MKPTNDNATRPDYVVIQYTSRRRDPKTRQRYRWRNIVRRLLAPAFVKAALRRKYIVRVQVFECRGRA